MTGFRTSLPRRSRLLTTALLLSATALTPAFAQEEGTEEIVVTATRSGAAQSTQKIPMAVTAIGAKDLETKAIESFRDLQFNVPSVTYSNGNFGSSNFQIRGIGLSVIAASADSGVSIHTNDVYNYTGGLMTAEYFDLDRIEVLRGPQSTLYGRNATGGVVNVITAKPRLDEQYGHVDVTYGEYNTAKVNVMANMPIVENELGLRIAYNYSRHDGYVENLFNDTEINGQNIQQVRASLRWTPSESTTIDLIGSYSYQKDSTMRYPKQLCHRDPTGVLGCLPDRLGYEPVNGSATAGTLLASTSSPFFTPFGVGGLLGLYDVPSTPGQYADAPVPRDNLTVATDLNPEYFGRGVFYMGNLEQEITPWLTMNVLVNFSDGESRNTSHYNNLVGDDIGDRLDAAIANMRLISQQFTGSTNAADRYIDTFFTAPDGSYGLPISLPGSGGILAGPQEGKTVREWSRRTQAFDQIEATGQQTTAEVRFTSDFEGPVNFLLAGFYIDAETSNSYWVNANSYDYALTQFGFLQYVLPTALGGRGGEGPLVIQGPTQFRSNTRASTLNSRAVFGEVYYDMIPDELKLTVGLRWTQDEKMTNAQVTLANALLPVGTTIDNIDYNLLAAGLDFDPDEPGSQVSDRRYGQFSQVTGRALLEWTPDLEFTDDSLFYASFARGFKSGGINPPASNSIPGLPAIPGTFEPEAIDAYELGAKNRFMDNALQANVTLWYYDYKNYQISDIVARTAFTSNIDASLYGLEAEFVYRPDDNWTFNLTYTNTQTELADGISIVDQRNISGGRSDVVTVKDPASAQNCAIVMLPGSNGVTPADANLPGFFLPEGGSGALAGNGVAHVNFGNCDRSLLDPNSPNFNPAFAAAFNGNYAYSTDPSGIPVDISGNELPQQPNDTITFGVQYRTDLDEEYELVVSGNYYWQGETWSRIINGPADRLSSFDVLNVSVQLNSIEDGWYAKVFATNLLDSRELTGAYLTDASSGLFSNVFVQDPRVIGVTFGADF